jgi:hypothetical protein
MPPNAAERVSSFPHFSEFHLTKLFWKVAHPDPMGDVCSLLITTSSKAEHNFKTVESEINDLSACRRRGFFFSAFLGVLFKRLLGLLHGD